MIKYILRNKISIYLKFIIAIGMVFSIHFAQAQTIVTPADSPCLDNSSFTTLSDIKIAESIVTDFSNGIGQTYIISAPANFIFNNGATPLVLSSGGGSLNISSVNITSSTLSFTYDLTGTSNPGLDKIYIIGLQIKPTTVSAAGSLLRTGGTAIQNGNGANAQGHGAVTSMPGVVTLSSNDADNQICQGSSITFTALPAGAVSYTFYIDGVANAPGASNTFTTNSLTVSNHVIKVISTDVNSCSQTSNDVSVLVNPIPTTPGISIISGSSSFCDDGGVSKVVLQSSPIASGSYQWYKGGTVVSGATGQTITLSSNLESGDYQVVLIGAGPTSCTSALSAKQTIKIDKLPLTPSISILSGSSPFCDNGGGNSVTLQSSAATGYQWYFNGISLSGQTSQTILLNNSSQSGDYQVQVFGPGPTSCPSALSVKKTIQIDATPSAPLISIISGSSSFCDDGGVSKVVLQSSPIASGSYQWYKGGTVVSGATGQTITLSSNLESGDYQVVLIGAGPTSCTSALSAKQTIKIDKLPLTPSISILSGSSPFCDNGGGNSVTLQSSAATGYQWYFNGISLSGQTSQTILLNNSSQSGNYQVQVFGPGPTSCPSALSVKKTIQIDATPSAPLISIISGSSSFCDDGGVSKVVLQSSPIASGSYQWYKGGTVVSGATGQTITLSSNLESGDYQVVLIGAGPTSCTSALSAKQTIKIDKLPLTPSISILSGSSPFCDNGGGNSVTLQSSAATGYQWYFNGISLSGQTSQTILLNNSSQSGNYQVQVFGPGPTSCPSALSVKKTIQIDATPSAPLISIISGSSSFCDDGGVSKVVLQSSPIASGSYQWYKGGTVVSGATGQTITLSSNLESGDYQVVLIGAGPTSCTSALSAKQTIKIDKLPLTPSISILSGSSPFCDNGGGNSVTLQSSAATGYQWYFNGISLSGQTSQTILLNNSSQSGDYQVQVFGPGPTSCPSALSVKKTIQIDATPSAPLISIISGSSSFCDDGGVSKVVLQSSPIASGSYQWYKGGTVVSGATGQTITLSSNLESGDYQVVLIGAGPTSCTSALSAKQTIKIDKLPLTPSISILSGSSPFCDNGGGNSVTLQSSAATGYQWYFNGISLSGQTSQTILLNNSSQSGDYQVQVFGPGPTSCPSALSVKKTIQIDATPSAPLISIISGSSSFCDDGGVSKVVLQSSPIASGSYQWYKGGTVVSGATGQTITLSSNLESGDYQVVLIGAGPTSCTSALSAKQTIKIDKLPLTPSISILSGSSPFCDNGGGNSVTLQSSAATGYQWYFNGISLSGQTSQTILLNNSSQSGNYQVQVFGPGPTSCPSALSVKKTIQIDATPSAPLISIISGSSSFCDDGGVSKVVLQSSPIASGSYQWYKGGTVVSGATGQTITLSSNLESGDYQVVLIGAGPTSCTSALSAKQTIKIDKLPLTPSISILSGSSPFCDNGGGNSVTLQSSAATGYQWYFNGISLSGQTSQTILLNNSSQSGNYQVQVFGPGPTSCPSALSTVSTINIYPQIINKPTSVQNPTICTGGSTNIVITGSQSGVNYQLYKGAVPFGIVVSGTGGNILLPTGPLAITTNFNILATIPATPCSLNLTPRTVIVSPAVTVSSPVSITVCEYNPINITATRTGPAGTQTWSGGLGSFGSPNSLATSYIPNPAEYGTTVILTITTNDPDGAGPCNAASSSTSVIINAKPLVLFSGLNAKYCVDAPVTTLLGFPSGGTFSGPGISGNTFSPASLSGNVSVTYTYTDAKGCTNSNTQSTFVNPLPVVSFSGLFASYQLNAPPSTLTGNPSGGIFNGAGIIGNTFYPGFAGVGMHTIRYTYTDVNGCTNFEDQTTDVQPAPVVDFSGLPSSACIDHAPYLLVGTPAGGVFSGPGITGNYFNPAAAGYGLSDITYTYTVGGVDNPTTKQVFVNNLPIVNFGVSDSVVCVDATPVILTGFPAGGNFSGAVGVSGNTFNPAVSGPGSFLVTYTYTDGNLCTNSFTRKIVVNPLPTVNFYNLLSQYCLNATPSTLVGNPTGPLGYFSGPGISGNTFFPSLAGIGSHTITYTYTDINGCTNHQDQVVKVSPLPVADFQVNNVCNSKTAGFTDLSSVDESLGDTIKSWSWTFDDASTGINNTSTLQNPTHQFSKAASYNVSLTITTNNNCSDTKIIKVDIGTIPAVKFSWNNLCEGGTTMFLDSTYFPLGGPNGQIASWNWNFDDPASGVNDTSTLKDPGHVFSNYGIYNVKLKVIAKSGCTDSLIQRVYILPSKTVSGPTSYFEDFNTSSGGWVQDSKSKIDTAWSWEYGNPNKTHINLPSGDNAWVTGLTGPYQNKEQSYVYSPCFDISTLKKPLISLKIFTDVQSGFDGAVLQASNNGGPWEKVGFKGSGINWYNASLINSDPGDQPAIEGAEGWSIENQGWVEAKYNLDKYLNSTNLRFRIAFGSNQDNPAGITLDGFAFDNVFIGERDRIVLLEHFSNIGQSASVSENQVVDSKIASSKSEVIDIQYHTNFPNPDSLFNNNPNDQSARALFYSIPDAPKTVIDGRYQSTLISKDSSFLNVRKLTIPFFDINIKFPPSPADSFKVKTILTPKVNLGKDSSFVLQVALVEKSVTINGIIYKNVLRKLLPNAAGTRFKRKWVSNIADSLTLTTAIYRDINVKNPANLAVIAFIQSDASKQVYQAAYDTIPFIPNVLTGTEPDIIEDFLIYPNPANQIVNIDFGKPTDVKYSWSIYDMLGKEVDSGHFESGGKLFTINTGYIHQGAYIIELKRKNKVTKNRRLIIIH